MKHIAGINTPSQRWARRNGACLAGRRRLGRQSIYRYFATCWHIGDMAWIACHLKTASPELQVPYVKATKRRSQWIRHASANVLLSRLALRRIMEAYDVQWPSEIL